LRIGLVQKVTEGFELKRIQLRIDPGIVGVHRISPVSGTVVISSRVDTASTRSPRSRCKCDRIKNTGRNVSRFAYSDLVDVTVVLMLRRRAIIAIVAYRTEGAAMPCAFSPVVRPHYSKEI